MRKEKSWGNQEFSFRHAQYLNVYLDIPVEKSNKVVTQKREQTRGVEEEEAGGI